MKSIELRQLLLECPHLEAVIVKRKKAGESCESEIRDILLNLEAQTHIVPLVSQDMGAFIETYIAEKRELLNSCNNQDTVAWCKSMIEHSIQCLPKLNTLSKQLKHLSEMK